MRQPLHKIGRFIAVATLGSTLGLAQDAGFGVAFKLRAGVGIGTNYDNLSRRTLGFGLEAGYGGSWGRVAAELGYQYKPGDQYAQDLTGMTVASGSRPVDTRPAVSSDLRRNSLEGVTLRLSYGNNISNDVSWRFGMQVGGARFRHEYIADISSAAGTGSAWEDTFNGTPTKSDTGLSPFLGLTFNVTDNSSLELNLIGISYTAINYNHVGGQNGAVALDTQSEHKRMVPTLEVGYAFRF